MQQVHFQHALEFPMNEVKDIIIYHTTDLHNRRAVFPYLRDIDRRGGDILLLDSGDAILGSSTVFIKREHILDIMEKLGYDAIAVGNREFHYIRKIFTSRAKQTRIPFISSNLNDLKGEQIIKKYIIKDFKGVKAGITAITPIQYGKKSFLKNISGFEFTDYFEALREVFAEIKDKVDLIIVLTHLEFKKCQALADAFKENLIFLGGHDHRVLFKPVSVGENWIFYSGCYGGYVNKINLKIYPYSGGGKRFTVEKSEIIEIN